MLTYFNQIPIVNFIPAKIRIVRSTKTSIISVFSRIYLRVKWTLKSLMRQAVNKINVNRTNILKYLRGYYSKNAFFLVKYLRGNPTYSVRFTLDHPSRPKIPKIKGKSLPPRVSNGCEQPKGLVTGVFRRNTPCPLVIKDDRSGRRLRTRDSLGTVRTM